ncbi:MAG UNVERIFIED_CONTAM: DUF4040 domain-containing protein [Anaerolineae bacterium]
MLIGVASVWFSIINKRHILSALSLGLFGYVIGGVFIFKGAPDVALVQFLVETLASVLLIIMISRLPHSIRASTLVIICGRLSRRRACTSTPMR